MDQFTGLHSIRALFLGVLILFPLTTYAQVAVSEIMYDPPGTDDKHEWIEVCNTSASSLDLINFKLFESGSAHALSAISGGSTLEPAACAVVADDAQTFKADHASYSGALLDSAFSLSNSGEVLVLRNAAGSDVDTTSYPVIAAKGDGNSLHRGTNTSSTYSASAQTPGAEPGFVALQTDGSAGSTVEQSQVTVNGSSATPNTSTTSVIQFQTVTVEPPPKLSLRINAPQTTTVDSLTYFSAEAYNAKGQPVKATIKWNFGDGMTDSGPEVRHAFLLDGSFLVHATAVVESLSDSGEVAIAVHPLSVSLMLSSDNKVLSIKNETATKIDMTAWKIRIGGEWYVFPDSTFLLQKVATKFSTTQLKLTHFSSLIPVELLNARNDILASVFPASAQKPADEMSLKDAKPLFAVSQIGMAGIRHEDVVLQPPPSIVPNNSAPNLLGSTPTKPMQVARAEGDRVPVETQRVREKTYPAKTIEISDKKDTLKSVPFVDTVIQTAAVGSSSWPLNPWYAALALLCVAAFVPKLMHTAESVQQSAALKTPATLSGLEAKDFELIEVKDDDV